MAGKSTRITVELGDAALARAVRIAAVESGRTVRDIVVEALVLWLGRTSQSEEAARTGTADGERTLTTGDERDYRSMIETLNRYRESGNR